MTFEVVLSSEAQKFFIAVEKSIAKKIAKCLSQLEQNPLHHPNIKFLKGQLSGHYRCRIGNYRIVYAVDETTKQVRVITIGHRNKVYKKL